MVKLTRLSNCSLIVCFVYVTLWITYFNILNSRTLPNSPTATSLSTPRDYVKTNPLVGRTPTQVRAMRATSDITALLKIVANITCFVFAI